MANNAFDDFFANGGDWGSSLLQYLPAQATYYSSPAGRAFGAASPRRSRYMQNAFQDVYSGYLGNIGGALREGREPATFAEFLESDPWTKRYGQLPQYERGVTQTASNPRTRFIFY
jgi:hypothetical protein